MGVDKLDGVFELCGCSLDWGARGRVEAAYPSPSWPSPWRASCVEVGVVLVVLEDEVELSGQYVPSAGWIFRHQLGGGEEPLSIIQSRSNCNATLRVTAT